MRVQLRKVGTKVKIICFDNTDHKMVKIIWYEKHIIDYIHKYCEPSNNYSKRGCFILFHLKKDRELIKSGGGLSKIAIPTYMMIDILSSYLNVSLLIDCELNYKPTFISFPMVIKNIFKSHKNIIILNYVILVFFFA